MAVGLIFFLAVSANAWNLKIYHPLKHGSAECEGPEEMSGELIGGCDEGECGEAFFGGNPTGSFMMREGVLYWFTCPACSTNGTRADSDETCSQLPLKSIPGIFTEDEFTKAAARGECARVPAAAYEDREDCETEGGCWRDQPLESYPNVYVKVEGAPESCTRYWLVGDTPAPKVSGDPYTIINGTRTQFWLPVEEYVKLVEVEDVELHGMSRSYASGKGQQWITDYRLMSKKKDVLRVSAVDPEGLVPHDVPTQNKGPPKDTLSVSIMVTTKAGWQRMTTTAAGLNDVNKDNVKVTFKEHHKRIGVGQKQAVIIESAGMVLHLFAAKANKFRTEEDRIKHLHVDMTINKLDYSKAAGVLPEIWGLVPMSSATQDMLKPPIEKTTFNI